MSKRRVQRTDLWCEVQSLTYDFPSRRGRLYMPWGNCCDMTGCIALFERIDPDCALIETYEGNERGKGYQADTIYRLTEAGWEALDQRGQHIGGFVKFGESEEQARWIASRRKEIGGG
jgi:hypothetical protein